MALKQKNICGARVRFFREKLNLTQDGLTARASLEMEWVVQRTYFAKIETGARCVSDEELVRLAKLLKCQPNDLVSWEKQ
jgi:transcriptional regulator with XRE-family HTH domain